MDTPPPLVPLLEAPLFGFLGGDLPAARGGIALFYLATALALFWAGTERVGRGRKRGGVELLTGAIAAALLLSSPIAQGYATIVMLEMPGALLLSIALAASLRFLGTGSRRARLLACATSTALFFCKYNYGLLWLAPFALFELGRVLGGDRSLRAVGRELRMPLLVIGVPVLVWALMPERWTAMREFFVNRDSGLGTFTAEAIGFYPRAWLDEYAPNRGAGWLTAFAALVFLLGAWRASAQHRLVALALGVGLAAVALHPYKLSRFLFPLAPLLWLSAAAVLADAIRWAVRRLPRPDPERGLAAIGAIVLAITAVRGVPLERLRSLHELRTVEPLSLDVLDGIANLVAERGDPSFVAVWNFLSPHLIEWHFATRHPDLYPERPGFVRSQHTGSTEGDTARYRDLARPGESLVVIGFPSDAPAWHPVHPIDVPSLDRVEAPLAADTRFAFQREIRFAESGYRLRIYERLPAHGGGSDRDR